MKEKVRLVEENRVSARPVVSNEMELNVIDGTSAKIQDVLRMVSRLKDTRTPVLIAGESGTGKELVARAIHFRGSLRKRPFVAVDCGSLVPTLIESELFGYEKGRLYRRTEVQEGLFSFRQWRNDLSRRDRRASAGNAGQAAARFAGKRRSARSAAISDIKIDVRVIAATNRDLESAYRAGTFRKDLYFRLNVVTIALPSLRERRSDIPALVQCVSRALRTRRKITADHSRDEFVTAV